MYRRTAKKKVDVVRHFQTRCWERLGVVLGQQDLKDELFGKRLGSTVSLVQSNTKTHFTVPREFLLKYGISTDKTVVAVYDKLRHAFVTVLTYENNDQMSNA